MSAIWIFREPRSGSTWFSNHVTTSLRRTHCFLDRNRLGFSMEHELSFSQENFRNTINQHDIDNTVFTTHFFSALTLMNEFDNPILIRCARKDKAEQFMSHMLVKYSPTHFTNITNDENLNKTKESFQELSKIETVVPKKEVDDYMRMVSSWNTLWDQYASTHQNYTIYYEDLCNFGIDIPEIGLYNCKIDSSGLTSQLPDYKTKVFLNYDMIQKWINEYR